MIGYQRARDREKLRAFVIDGADIQRIADEFDISYDAARARLNRANLAATPKFERTVRERAEGMTFEDGFFYLLGVLENACGAATGREHHPVDDIGIDLTGSQRRVMIALWDANGGYRSADQLIKAMRMIDEQYQYGTRYDVSQLICQTRKKLRGTPYRIDVLKYEGWRLVVAGNDEAGE